MGPFPLDASSDADLLARTAAGPDGADAFATFYRRHELTVLAYLRRRLPRAELAADLAAETFASALHAAGRFDASLSRDGQAVGWLLTIAHRHLLVSVRRGRVSDKMRRRLALSEPLVLVDEALARVDELASLPEELDELVAALPEALRLAVLARVVDERAYAEIAEQLQCSQLVVRQRVSRGLTKLRSQLSEETP